jgi:radical SAM superfamily enzyme YgiQ (UPF0313 family)
MYDIIFLSIPYANITIPPLGISVLNGVVKSNGYKSRCIDLSMELSKECVAANYDFESTQLSLISPELEIDPALNDFFDRWADKIIAMNTRYIGISVFSFWAHYTAFYLCQVLKQKNISAQIVIGGPGVGTGVPRDLETILKLSGTEKLKNFGQILKDRKLADHVVFGDGEQAILDLLGNNSVDTDYQIANYKEDLPFANFDDYNFKDYKGQLNRGYPQLPVFTSKGCVRNCDFCDVNVVQQKFRFRQGQNVVRELIYLADRYGIRDFNFADSLVNGSLSSMTEWVRELATYNKANPEKRITWSASWICRPIGQMKPEMYKLLSESGCDNLTIGVESGSNHVLAAMHKKTDVEALYYEAEQFYKHDIKFLALLIIGHWSERWSDFVETLQMLYQMSNYAKSGNFIAAGIGATMMIIKDTPMYKEIDENKLEYITPHHWWTPVNPDLTLKERLYRLLLAERFCLYYNIPLQERVFPFVYKSMLEKDLDQVDAFYTERVQYLNINQKAEFYYKNFHLLTEEIEANNPVTELDVSIDLVSHTVTDECGIEIWHNNKLISSNLFKSGLQKINFVVQLTQETDLRIKFTNKQDNDTIVDAAGNILNDKFIEIKDLTINQINLTNDIEFYMQHLQYQEREQIIKPKFGMWINDSELIVSFAGSFKSWYHRNSKKNSILSAEIITQLTVSTTYDDDYYRNKIIEKLDTLKF